FDEHPEWFSMIEGKRAAPVNNAFKLETTNPKVVEFFASKAVENLKTNPHKTTFSLSPNDGRFWSESIESKKFYDPAPQGRDHPLVTRLVLKWYNDVSTIVAKRYPTGTLAGYLYSD